MPRFSAVRSSFWLLFVLVVVLVQVSLNLLLSYCGETKSFLRRDKNDFTKAPTSIPVANPARNDKYIVERLRKTERKLQSLRRELELNKTRKNNGEIERLRKENEKLSSQLAKCAKLEKIIDAQEFSQIKAKISKGDFLKGDTVNNELTVVPFDSFTSMGIYTVNKEGLVDRPARRPLGKRYTEHSEVLKFSQRVLNDELSGGQTFAQSDLVTGITRLDRMNGMLYNLFFRAKKPNKYHRVKIRRPYSHLELVDSVETVDTSKEAINLILPLSGRTRKFQAFLQRFADVCVRWDSRVFLTVVYFGTKDRESVKDMLLALEKRENFTDYKLIFEEGPFSRGAGLQKGVMSWEKGNNIMFFCDVDVYFKPDFLERCRLYAEPGRMLYYPIVYSLYNPQVVYNGVPPSTEQQLFIGKNNGFWRDFGFGMTCLYRNDFIASKGFDTTIQGWGIEDLKLYRQFLRSDLAVIRATDYGIFHLYHPKFCNPAWSGQQYMSCLHSKAVSEGTHRQMGMLAFGSKLFSNLKPDWKTKLAYKPDFSERPSRLESEQAQKLWKKADELEVEVLEIKLLKKRLEAVMNLTVLREDTFKHKDISVNITDLDELQSAVEKKAKVVKQFARLIEKNYSTQTLAKNSPSTDD